MADPVYTPAQIAESKRRARLAFERHRSESLTNSHTSSSAGVLSTPAKKPAGALATARKPRPGILGYVADAWDAAVNR